MPRPSRTDLSARVRRALHRARLAPSPHNTQPARWWQVDETLTLVEEPAARLPVGDPTGRDQRAALGAAWEAAVIALSSEGLRWDAAVVDARDARSAQDAHGGLAVVRGALVDDPALRPHERHNRALDERAT